MIISRVATDRGPVIGVGLTIPDVGRLRRGFPIGFSLRAALGDASLGDDRVLVAYARPDQLIGMRNGYFPLMADARVVLILSDDLIDKLGAGVPLVMDTPGAPIGRFVVFVGDAPPDAVRAFRLAGLLGVDRPTVSCPSVSGFGPPVTVVPAR